MSKVNGSNLSLGLTLGIPGCIAGIGLLFTDSWLTGIFGSIASTGIAYKRYQDSKSV